MYDEGEEDKDLGKPVPQPPFTGFSTDERDWKSYAIPPRCSELVSAISLLASGKETDGGLLSRTEYSLPPLNVPPVVTLFYLFICYLEYHTEYILS